MSRSAGYSVKVLLCLSLFGASAAHVRLMTSGGNPLYWQNEESVSVVIQSLGSDDVPDGSDEIAVRLAIDAWNRATGSSAQLIEDASPSEQARTDWESDSIHLLYFDEDDSSGYFPPSSQIVALTPLWFFSSGRISDADVLFNGDGFDFTTSGEPGGFDIQDVATHELGHLLGLDHTGVVGAALHPYVDPTVILHRSLALDDQGGLRDAYPAQAFATISGRIVRASGGSAVAGAHVVARDVDGRTAGGALADASGDFDLRGLPGGTYEVWAVPLDGPVEESNLSSFYTVHTDFEATAYGAPAVVADGGNTNIGELEVGADVAISLGRASDALPLRAISGVSQVLSLGGTGLVFGSTLTASDPEVAVAAIHFGGVFVTFIANVPPGVEPGHVDLIVTTPTGDVAVLPAALELTPPSPHVTSITPESGSTSGGAGVLITGTGFRPGARVVLGDRVYADGEGDVEVLSDTQIALTTLSTVAGVHDVVVIDATGVEGRLANGFQAGMFPSIDVVFPAAGQTGGGTRVVVTGEDFAPGLLVSIDGDPQLEVDVTSANRVEFHTAGGLPGGPYQLELRNPGGELATAAFVYVTQADPLVALTAPSAGKSGGGEPITLHGSGFTSATEVFFGANPDTGEGGVQAGGVTLVDASTLSVLTPAHGSGAVSVLTSDPITGQATVLPGGFSFEGGGGGGGGGCGSVAAPRLPGGPREFLAAMGVYLALLLLLLGRASRTSRTSHSAC